MSEKRPLRNLIAWLSLCLLTAGLGQQIDAPIRELWIPIGLFGLVSAVALDIALRTREAVTTYKIRQTTQRRLHRNLAKLLGRHMRKNVAPPTS